MSRCHSAHERTGLVTTHPTEKPSEIKGSFMAVTTCDRPACISAWKAYIRRKTGLAAVYSPDPQPRSS
jgi:hypothetical protein